MIPFEESRVMVPPSFSISLRKKAAKSHIKSKMSPTKRGSLISISVKNGRPIIKAMDIRDTSARMAEDIFLYSLFLHWFASKSLRYDEAVHPPRASIQRAERTLQTRKPKNPSAVKKHADEPIRSIFVRISVFLYPKRSASIPPGTLNINDARNHSPVYRPSSAAFVFGSVK